VGDYKIAAVDPARLVFEGSGKKALGVIAVGLLAALWGGMAWMAPDRADARPAASNAKRSRGDDWQQRHAERSRDKTLALLPVGLIMAFIGAAKWGSGCIVDGNTCRLRKSGWFGGGDVEREAMSQVLLRLNPKTSHQPECVDLCVQDTNGKSLLFFGQLRTSSADAANLAWAAPRIAALLRLPMNVDGEYVREATRELQEAVEQARNGGPSPSFLPRHAA
jgi:hypothetical protein